MEKALTWEQIREMAGHRIEFEAHTSSHINIRHANVDTIEREIVSSKLPIEKHVGREVRGFAYPYGKDVASYAAVEHLLRKHGFRYACTTEQGLNDTDTSPYLLKRHALPSTVSSALLHRDLILQFARSDVEDTHIPVP
jgi:peptidoglycan/xylan/chitin deacetylase (PgdA/CDA1 family)